MVDNQQNILVEFDYNNIIVVDPNKIIDEDGKAQQRLVRHEELVMYANLECKVLPRTKLAIGVDNNDAIRTVSVASINFLKPGGKTFLDNTYTDEITGKDTLKGEGINQPKSESIKNPNKDNDFFIRQTITSGGKSGAVDTGLLGITTISVRTDTAFTPRINVKLVDVKGRALFEGGDNSPYAAFFNLPYPPFYLTLKGFYGKAIRLTLMLEKFTSSYNSMTSNFDIDLTFLTYKYTVLQEVNMGYVLAAPRMYKNRIKIQTTQGNPSQFSPVDDAIFERGYQKVKELYSEYKSKGLIPDDFPEITIPQMQASIENFVTNVLDKFTKENLDPLSFCDTYQRELNNFAKEVYYILNTSWFDKYMDKKEFFILNDKTKVYQFKKEFESLEKQKGVAIPELDKLIELYRGLLENNPTLGINGSYTIQGKTKKISIPFMVKGIGMFEKKIQYGDINIKETFVNFKGRQPKDDTELKNFEVELQSKILKNSNVNKTKGDNNPQSTYYFFEGPNSFIEAIDDMGKELKKFREEIESELTTALSNLLQSKDSGLGFVPTIRNVLAVVFASGEAFLRLLNDVHTKAYAINSQESGLKIRKSVVFDKEVAGASQDNLTSGVDKTVPIYPWPQVIVATNGENGQEKYEIKYPGSTNILNRTKAYLYDVWPEVEFVEEFVKAFVEKTLPPSPLTPTGNEVNEPNRLTLNAIEFPVGNDLYANKEEVKFFYEIYERILYTSFYSRLSRVNDLVSDSDKITNLIAECENINITKSLSNDNPFLIQKLKQYGINNSNFTAILRQFSNQGLGESWQNFIRGIFNTKYIQNEIENSEIEVIDKNIFTNTKSQPTVSLPNEKEFVEYIDNSNTNNKFDLLDIYPFTNTTWDKKYLANGTTILRAENSFNTTKTLTFNTANKVICSFTDINATDKIRPITNFIYNQVNQPLINKLTDFKELYQERSKFNLQLPTEGNVRYLDYSGYVTDNQTTSIFNTPYFINAIQKGVKNFRENKEYPFVEAAYLFINSLPLATLKEKFKDDNGTTPPSATDLDYIYATLKKFGAIHKIPYAWIVKMGSIWHRYKKYVNDNEDILDSVWSGFSYTLNFDPVTTANTRNYGLTINNVQIDIVLQKDTTIGTELSTLINTGFYPKLINDFNVFYQGFQVFTGYTDTDIQSGITKFGVQINYAADAIIDLPEGSDPNNDMRDIRVIPWTVSVNTPDKKFTYIFPSNGSVTNQAFDECVDLGKLEVEVNNNQSLYDGSVRLFWAAPNYGYFINEKITKPSPEYYLKQILSGQSEQENFSINGDESKYSDISEMFSVLDKYVLDSFEQVFLNFSKSVYDYNTPTSSNNSTGILNFTPNQTGTNTESSFFNFQKLMRELMKVPATTGSTGQEIIEKIQGEQLKSIQSYISQFLKYDIVFKFGNTGNFDRKLFYTFSSLPLTDPYTWETYTSKTPNALPTNGGSVTLQNSQTQFPKEWKRLKTLVGFSTIPELVYSNNGSYITDFFVDLNIAFNVENINLFSDIIKVYATQKLNQFQPDPIPAPLPPVTVGPRRVAEAKLKNGNTITVNRLGPKNSGVLRNTQNTILFENSPVFGGPTDADYKSVVDNVIVAVYNSVTTNSGDPQYIVSFVSFADPVYNQTPTPQNKGGLQKFYQSVSNYLLGVDNFMGKVINNLMAKLQVSLPNVNNTPEPEQEKEQNIPQTKDDLYESFKSLNDKWISGNDFTTKTFFEDVLIMDRASRNIGDKILVDIYKLKDRLTNINPKTGMLTFVQSILIENHFVVMNIPAYVNFYNVQDAVKDPKPKPEGTLEMANTLFGTFLNVDYRNSSSKLVCFYGGKPSEILDIKNNVDYRYRNDVFDLRRATDNPLVENQTNKKDWDKSNKVVGFNVDMGPQNQGVFQSFSVSQGSGVATAESLQILNQMANQAGNRGGATQSLSLYNVYKNRSYNCTVQMMGCALIQPTMYFNLRYVPMFSGPYMILSVTHSISPGSFETTFTGIRQPVAALPKVDNYIQALRTNLLKSILDKNKEKKAEENKNAKNNVISQKNSAVTNANGGKTPTTVQACEAKAEYSSFTKVDNPGFLTLTYKETYDIIMKKISDFNLTDDGKLKYAVFATLYLESDNSGANLKAWENNYAGIDLTETWGPLSSYFVDKEYFCLQSSNGTENLPYAVFETPESNIEFITKRFKDRMGNVADGSAKSIAKFWILNRKQKQLPENVYTSMDSTQISDIESRVQKAISTFDGFLQITPTPTPTPTPSPLPPNTPPNPILNVYDPLKQQFRFSILPDTGNWGISRCELTTKCTSDCANDTLNSDITGLIRPELETGTPTVFGGISVYTGTTQNATILLEDLFDEIDCGLETNKKADLVGKYSFEIKVTAIPLKADLQTYDSTRQNVYSTAFYSDEIK